MDQVTRIRQWLHWPGRLGLAMVLAVSLGLALQCATEAAGEGLEYQVKAAFLLNFTKFVEWPEAAFESPEAPLSICVLGDELFGDALDRVLGGEGLNGRKLVVQRLKSPPPPKACQMLFVGRAEKSPVKLFPVIGPGVLTVGEGRSFLHDGGVIAFVIENGHVRFGINKTAAQAAGLKLSSKLFTVARFVEK